MEFLRGVVADPRTERVIMALIVVNAVTLGMETSETLMAHYGGVLHVLDRVILAVFHDEDAQGALRSGDGRVHGGQRLLSRAASARRPATARATHSVK